MAFDLGSVKSIGVPAWLRALVGFIVASAIVSDVELAWIGLHRDAHKDWFVLAVQLGGTLIPLLVAALLFAFSTTGPETLRHKTTHLLLNLIPSSISYVATQTPRFDSIKSVRRWGHFKSRTDVTVALHPGDFCCSYCIRFPDVWSSDNGAKRRVAYLMLDLKVYGINMALCVPKDSLEAYCARNPAFVDNRKAAFRDAFRATLAGAEAAGCTLNDNIVDLTLDGQQLSSIVAMRTLTPTFLNDPAEQLYVAQDLVAMLRGFWRERSDWFPIVQE